MNVDKKEPSAVSGADIRRKEENAKVFGEEVLARNGNIGVDQMTYMGHGTVSRFETPEERKKRDRELMQAVELLSLDARIAECEARMDQFIEDNAEVLFKGMTAKEIAELKRLKKDDPDAYYAIIDDLARDAVERGDMSPAEFDNWNREHNNRIEFRGEAENSQAAQVAAKPTIHAQRAALANNNAEVVEAGADLDLIGAERFEAAKAVTAEKNDAGKSEKAGIENGNSLDMLDDDMRDLGIDEPLLATNRAAPMAPPGMS